MDLNELQNFYHAQNKSNTPCFVVNITAENGIWQSENPLTQSLPLLPIQLAATIFVTRAVYYLLRPLAVPRIFTDFLVRIARARTHDINMQLYPPAFLIFKRYHALTLKIIYGVNLRNGSWFRTCITAHAYIYIKMDYS